MLRTFAGPTTVMVNRVITRVLDFVRDNQTERFITNAVDAAARDGERPHYFLSFLNSDRRAFVTTWIDAVAARTPEAVYV